MTVVFADTAFWIAMLSRRDEHHTAALAWARRLATDGIPLVTTELVLWEWLNAMSHPDTRGAAITGYDRCHGDPKIEVVGHDEAAVQQALDLYRDRADKAWSLTDCHSLVVMEARGVTHVLSSDHHFEQAGHRILLRDDPALGIPPS